MINEKLQEAINNQINAELYSSYLYLSMSAYFESIGLKGFANWMRVQAQEEVTHAMKFYGFINDRGAKVLMQPIEGPETNWESPLAVFEYTLEHERKVTGMINDLVDLSVSERDHALTNFLQWFIGEQVEEEANAGALVEQLKLMGDSGNALFMIDRELAARTFVYPPAGGGGEGA
jgi:ferritin